MISHYLSTGCSIKIRPHSFNHTCSHDKNTFNFKTVFIYHNTELYFEVLNSFIGQLAQKCRVVKVLSPKQKYLEMVHFTSLTGYNLIFFCKFWTCSCQSRPTMVFQLKVKQLQVQNWQKNQNITCETSKMHLLQIFFCCGLRTLTTLHF